MAISSAHLAEALTRAEEHRTTQPGGKTAWHFCVAISREAGTYGAALARRVGERLGWPVYDRELLQRIAADMGVQGKLVENVDERQTGWVRECLSAVFAIPTVSETKYLRHLIETVLTLAAQNDCVIVGRGATNVLPLATTLRVRIIAPREDRIEAVRREHSITLEEAAARVDATDQERREFVQTHFRMDPHEPTNYDLVLNASRLSTEDCVDLIVVGIEKLRAKTTRPAPAAVA